jgi:MFS family permease
VPQPPSAWAPLRLPVYRAIWTAVLVSQLGTWMQTVGAQWLLVDERNAATLVALVQTASTLPVVLLALPAGALADSFDRRWMLVGVQGYQAVVAGTLTIFTVAGALPSSLLLAFTFALGIGAALTMPTYQALIPEMVPRHQLPSAAALGGVSVNLARAVGPAVAGVLVARTGVAAVFGLNAVSFLFFLVVLLRWRRPPEEVASREPLGSAIRLGGRYVRHSTVVRRTLLRTALFVAPATAIWALLPLVATEQLGLDASGYGLLLGALGVGAVGGAFLLPRARSRWSTNRLLVLSSVATAAAMALLVLTDWLAVALLVLLPAGMAWIAVLSGINATLQLFLPVWVRARGLAVYQMVLFGAQAVAAALWGVVASWIGTTSTFLVAAGAMLAGGATVRWWPLRDVGHLDREPVVLPDPQLGLRVPADVGPVLVQIAMEVEPDREPDFLAAMDAVRRSRLRSGATRWRLYRVGEQPSRFVEVYAVPSWGEHLRQHSGRLTATDRDLEERAFALAAARPEVSHLLPADAVTAAAGETPEAPDVADVADVANRAETS